MDPRSYMDAIFFSYRMFFRLLLRTYFRSRHTQARLTCKRFVIMTPFFLLLFFINTLHWICFLLDEVLFPKYRNAEITEPVFIVGVPRSGTSFMHRVFAEDKDRFTTLRLWELILAPAITERKCCHFLGRCDKFIGGPISRLIKMIERRAVGDLDAIHEISLNDPEEDYFLLVPLFACYLMILPFPFPEELGHLAYFDDETPRKNRALIMRFYRSCLKRHLYLAGPGKQLLSKNVSFTPMVKALDETFPDCRIICNVRNPLKSVPSHISSMTAGAELFDNDIRGRAFRDQLIDLQRYSFSHAMDFLPALPPHRHAFVRMEDLKDDLAGQVQSVYGRFGYGLGPAFAGYLQTEKEKEKHYASGHRYSLSAFGLKPENIAADFSRAMERFGYQTNGQYDPSPDPEREQWQ